MNVTISAKAISEIQKLYPSALVNNSRFIVRKAMERMKKNPAETYAKQLESLGFPCDFSAKDYGEAPKGK